MTNVALRRGFEENSSALKAEEKLQSDKRNLRDELLEIGSASATAMAAPQEEDAIASTPAADPATRARDAHDKIRVMLESVAADLEDGANVEQGPSSAARGVRSLSNPQGRGVQSSTAQKSDIEAMSPSRSRELVEAELRTAIASKKKVITCRCGQEPIRGSSDELRNVASLETIPNRNEFRRHRLSRELLLCCHRKQAIAGFIALKFKVYLGALRGDCPPESMQYFGTIASPIRL